MTMHNGVIYISYSYTICIICPHISYCSFYIKRSNEYRVDLAISNSFSYIKSISDVINKTIACFCI